MTISLDDMLKLSNHVKVWRKGLSEYSGVVEGTGVRMGVSYSLHPDEAYTICCEGVTDDLLCSCDLGFYRENSKEIKAVHGRAARYWKRNKKRLTQEMDRKTRELEKKCLAQVGKLLKGR